MSQLTLEQLFGAAQTFGNVNVFQRDDRTWSAQIEFRTIEHVKLKAESGYKHMTVNSAVSAAIENAVVIVESMRAKAPRDTADLQESLGIKDKIAKLLGVSK